MTEVFNIIIGVYICTIRALDMDATLYLQKGKEFLSYKLITVSFMVYVFAYQANISNICF